MNRRQDGDTRQGEILTTGFIVEVQGFHYQSVGPLRKTRHTGSVSGEEEFLHHKQNDSVANLLKDFMISSVNYVTVVPLWFFYWPCKLTRRRFTRSPIYRECCSSWAHLSVRSEGWNVFFLKCHKWYICNAYEKKRLKSRTFPFPMTSPTLPMTFHLPLTGLA